MLIVYGSVDEVIVTTKKKEHKTIKEYFIEGGRDIDDYERKEYPDEMISVSNRFYVDKEAL